MSYYLAAIACGILGGCLLGLVGARIGWSFIKSGLLVFIFGLLNAIFWMSLA